MLAKLTVFQERDEIFYLCSFYRSVNTLLPRLEIETEISV